MSNLKFLVSIYEVFDGGSSLDLQFLGSSIP